jgi:hypothetical protein
MERLPIHFYYTTFENKQLLAFHLKEIPNNYPRTKIVTFLHSRITLPDKLSDYMSVHMRPSHPSVFLLCITQSETGNRKLTELFIKCIPFSA